VGCKQYQKGHTFMMLVFDCSSARYMYDARVCMQECTLHV